MHSDRLGMAGGNLPYLPYACVYCGCFALLLPLPVICPHFCCTHCGGLACTHIHYAMPVPPASPLLCPTRLHTTCTPWLFLFLGGGGERSREERRRERKAGGEAGQAAACSLSPSLSPPSHPTFSLSHLLHLPHHLIGMGLGL